MCLKEFVAPSAFTLVQVNTYVFLSVYFSVPFLNSTMIVLFITAIVAYSKIRDYKLYLLPI